MTPQTIFKLVLLLGVVLMVASIGFIGKLFAEAIEEISLKQVEAVRATGAPL